MRYRMSLLLSVLTVGILGLAVPAPADYETNGYNLQHAEIRGVVEKINDQEAYIRTDDGGEIGVQLGPQSYWDDRGYYLPEGEYVRMEVWYDPYGYTDWYFAGQIWGPGFHFVLTNGYGVPYWIIAADDYYYSLGFRASCVSYMVWYDCPPVYFVYVVLPPPPPYYTCYYGPRWRHNHHEWHHHGPGHDRDHSYGDVGDRRPGRRGGRDPDVPIDPPRLDPRIQPDQELVSRWQAPPAAPKLRPKQNDQYRAPAQPPARKLQPRPPEPRERPNPSPVIQPKPREVKYHKRPAKPQVREQRAPNGNAPRQYSKPQGHRQSGGANDAKHPSGNRGQERGNRRR